MGLDSGIIIKHKTKAGEEFLKKNFKHLEENYAPGEYEFGYWRKCWNIRERFFDVFRDRIEDHNWVEIEFKLSDIPMIVNKVLKYFLDEDNWEYEGCYSQVFTWIEELPSIATAMRDLTIFYEMVIEEELSDEDFEISFYDSY